MRLFRKEQDYAAFERVLEETFERTRVRILAYCVMPTHWHLLLWPRKDGELSEVLRWLTVTHTQRWHAHRHTSGTGPVYKGRFKSFPVQSDEHFLTVARYVERNALRADLVERPEEWQWSSLWRRCQSDAAYRKLLSPWPIPCPNDWPAIVRSPQTEAELEAIRLSVLRGRPYGDENWTRRTAKRLGLESTLRNPGRPRKAPQP